MKKRDYSSKRLSTFLFLLLLFCMTGITHAHTLQSSSRQIQGKIVDELNEPLTGVNIVVQGTSKGVITDIDGNYTIEVSDTETVLSFSYLGYLPQKIKVGKNKTINVVLKEDTMLLDEVVVVGYGTMKKSDLTGAVTSIKPDGQEATSVLSVDNLLQGKVAGLTIGNSVATPGAANTVTIRGANSLRGDNQPLYVIDNIPQASTGEFASSAFGGDFQTAQDPLTSLNPQDIEDIQVLKDASATAIYGSRGANGVILITTKKGKPGKTKVNVNATYSILNATRLHKMINLEEFADFRNAQLGEGSQQFFKENGEVRYIFSGNVYDPEDPMSYHVLNYRNWQKEIYRTAFSQNYSATLNGGSELVKYYISTNFKDINGVVKQTSLKQGSIRSNFNMKLAPSVDLNLSLSGSLKKNDMMSGGDTKGGATGSITRTAIDSYPYLIPEGEQNLSDEEKTTVWSWLDDYDDITNEKSFRGSADLVWKINKHFSFNTRVGGNLLIQDRSRWFGLQLFRGRNENGSLGITSLDKKNYTIENLLNYSTKISNFANLSAVVGVTYDEYKFLNRITSARDFQSTALRTKGLHMARVINENQPIQRDYQLLSYLARVNLSMLEGRYLATLNFRSDGSSKFKSSNRWSYFPSFSLAWRLEQENFIKDNYNWIDQLKLRVGYGQTGNQSINPYNSFYTYSEAPDYASPTGDKELSIGVSNLQNPNLKWEKTASFNAGIDFSFLQNRLHGTLDWYRKTTSDLLISRSLGPSVGFGSILTNQGSLANQGVEFTLNANVLQTKDWDVNLSGNIAFNKAKIKKLGLPEKSYGNERYVAYLGNSIGDHFGPANIFIEGKAPGLFWGYKTDGIIQENDEVHPSKISNVNPGNIKFVDTNNDQVIDENDKTIIGDPNPDFTYGFQASVSFKSLTLSTSFNGVYNNDVLNANIRYESLPGRQASNLTKKAFYAAWTPENKSNLYPGYNSSIPTQAVLDRYIEDGSFLRCSDISLIYKLPKLLVNKIGFNSIDVFASVKNAFIITNYSGYDPEVNSFAFDGLRRGVDINSMPQPRSFIFGLNVSF